MIREADIKDEASVYALMCELEEKELDREKFLEIYSWNVENEMHHILLYTDSELSKIKNETSEKDIVSGVLHLRIEPQLHHTDNVAEIVELAVTKKERSKNIGKKLFDYACEISKEKNCAQIEVTSNQLRIRAHKFYEKQGMRNTHYKLVKKLFGEMPKENAIGAM